MPNENKKPPQDKLRFLVDRMAILMVVCKQRHGGDWMPWFQDGLYDADDGLGAEVREWPEFKTAMEIIRNMLRRFDNEQASRRG